MQNSEKIKKSITLLSEVMEEIKDVSETLFEELDGIVGQLKQDAYMCEIIESKRGKNGQT